MSSNPFAFLVETHEAELVEAVFTDKLLSRGIGAPSSVTRPYRAKFCVPPVDLGLPPAAFGDVDALVVEGNGADSASAVEFKRVKISSNTFQTGQINKLHGLKKAAHQANAMCRAGFAFGYEPQKLDIT